MAAASKKVTMAALGLLNGCVGCGGPRVKAALAAAVPSSPGGVSSGLRLRVAACLCELHGREASPGW